MKEISCLILFFEKKLINMQHSSNFISEIFLWLRSHLHFEIEIKSEQKLGYHTLTIQEATNNSLCLILRPIENKINAAIENEISDLLESHRKEGERVVIIWEDLWHTKPAIIQSRIGALLGMSERIPGRLTKARRIDKITASSFLTQQHLQGPTTSKYQFGLYLPNKYFRILNPTLKNKIEELEELLVAVGTFSHVRVFNKTDKPFRSYELIRFANRLNTTVVGGLNKLLTAFSKEIKPDDIMTYADLDWSNGASYRKLGFEEISKLSPITFIIDSNSKQRRLSKLEDNNSETDPMVKNSGSIKFVRKSFGN